MRPRRQVTLAEIAQRAGVHVSTVSRSLADVPTGVGSEKAARIRAIAEEMGYRRDLAATMLRTGKSGALGMIVPRITDYVLSRIVEGVDDAARRLGYTTVVVSSNDDPQLRLERIEQLLERRVDGLIIGDARLDGDEVLPMLKRRDINYALVNRRLSGYLSATADDAQGGRLAAEHLLSLGHTEIGVIAGLDYATTCVDRTYGFVHYYKSHGVTVRDDMVLTSRADTQGGYEAARELLARNPQLTALFTINDFAAIGAMGAVRESGRTTGVDVAIVGYNDIPLAQYLPVPLTSVHSPMFEMGQEGARLLTRLIDGSSVETLNLAPSLVVRESSMLSATTPTTRIPE